MPIRKQILTVSLAALAALPSTPAHADESELIGGIIGGALGGLIGNQFGQGDGKTAATIAGTILGAAAGALIAKELDEADRRAVSEARARALRDQSYADWNGPRSGARGRVTVLREGRYARDTRVICRSYRSEIQTRNRSETNTGYACEDGRGNWQEVQQTEITWTDGFYESYERRESRQEGRDDRYDHRRNDRRGSQGPNQRPDPRDQRDDQIWEPHFESRGQLPDVICAAGPNGQAVPKNLRTGKLIGDYYFNSQRDCQLALQTASHGVLCTAGRNGQAVPTRASDGKKLGDYFFMNINDCVNAVRGQRDSLICTAGSHGQAIPTVIRTEEKIGAYFFSDARSCQAAIANKRGPYICTAGQYGKAAIYDMERDRFVDEYYRNSLDECIDSLPY